MTLPQSVIRGALFPSQEGVMSVLGRYATRVEPSKYPTLHPGGAKPFATSVFDQWVEHPGYRSPQDDPMTRDWQRESNFRQIGQHEMRISGQLVDVPVNDKEYETRVEGRVDSLTPTRLETPKHLYRAARPEHADRWNWFDRHDLARLLCDERGGLQIYTCEAEEIFGVVRVDRTEESILVQGRHQEQWNEWIVKPKNVRKISRWRDPFADIKNLPAWEKRGVHAVEAASIVGGWFRNAQSNLAPMDREQGGYWLSQFQYMGQFEAHSSWDEANPQSEATSSVTPAVELIPPRKLYRGAPERLKGRWSWTAEPETAQLFVDLFCPDEGKVWECEAETVFGVIRAHTENPGPGHLADFSEWIILPKEDTIREWRPSVL